MTDTFPERPTESSPEVIALYVGRLKPHISAWLESRKSNLQITADGIADLVEAVAADADPYKVARYLDVERGWNVDAALVDVFARSRPLMIGACREIETAWAMEHGVRFPANTADHVSFLPYPDSRAIKVGVVEAVFEGPASAIIRYTEAFDTSPSKSWTYEVPAERVTHIHHEENLKRVGHIRPTVGFSLLAS